MQSCAGNTAKIGTRGPKKNPASGLRTWGSSGSSGNRTLSSDPVAKVLLARMCIFKGRTQAKASEAWSKLLGRCGHRFMYFILASCTAAVQNLEWLEPEQESTSLKLQRHNVSHGQNSL